MFGKKLKERINKIDKVISTAVGTINALTSRTDIQRNQIKQIQGENAKLNSQLDKAKNRIAEIEDVLTRTDKPTDYIGSEIDAKVEQSEFDKVVSRLQELKQYTECEICGCLVNKEKAEMKWELRGRKGEEENIMEKLIDYQFGCRGAVVTRWDEEKEAVKVYTCKRCLKNKKK